jgi:hypothetical protein
LAEARRKKLIASCRVLRSEVAELEATTCLVPAMNAELEAAWSFVHGHLCRIPDEIGEQTVHQGDFGPHL